MHAPQLCSPHHPLRFAPIAFPNRRRRRTPELRYRRAPPPEPPFAVAHAPLPSCVLAWGSRNCIFGSCCKVGCAHCKVSKEFRTSCQFHLRSNKEMKKNQNIRVTQRKRIKMCFDDIELTRPKEMVGDYQSLTLHSELGRTSSSIISQPIPPEVQITEKATNQALEVVPISIFKPKERGTIVSTPFTEEFERRMTRARSQASASSPSTPVDPQGGGTTCTTCSGGG